ncbi:hypothetical protein EYF80_065130 [Liparis tanakae]|uniref:Uncharacterized protein n=1 Tax=Liparis tanakae TaxID=230148 RepID=A0A4Z2E882_9TELE|nr:hypothetical protein EYF80_065130 [Liparis tanakae]
MKTLRPRMTSCRWAPTSSLTARTAGRVSPWSCRPSNPQCVTMLRRRGVITSTSLSPTRTDPAPSTLFKSSHLFFRTFRGNSAS